MAKISILIASLLFCTLIQGQVPMSPCPQYFTYMTDPTTNEIKGQIEIPSPPKNVQIHLRVTLKTNVEMPTKYDGRLDLARTKEESVQAVEQGRSLLYHLHFPLRQPIPTLTEIWFNGEQYCLGPPPSGNFITTIMLEHTLYPPNVRPSATMHRITTQPPKKPIRSTTVTFSQGIGNIVFLRPTTTSSRPAPQYHNNTVFLRIITTSQQAQNDNNNNYNNINVIQRPITTSRPAPQSTPQPASQNDNTNNNNNNSQCGISQQNYGIVNRLVVNGAKTLPGQWPWLVALFLVRTEHKFQCGGSILTNKHIITAAHCLKSNLYSNDSIPLNVLEVTLGQFKLREIREYGSVSRKVADYVIHPDYAHANTGDSDLAILILKTPVEYSLFIKPICLWSGSTILQNVVNRTGYVVGWGQNEYSHLHTEEPRMATVSIINHAECHWNDPRFASMTTNRTFCAGSLDNSIPCNGDSGSGLIFFDAVTGRYQLRGIVSRTIPVYNQSEQTCDPTKFTVYADVAQYIPWIQEQISQEIGSNVRPTMPSQHDSNDYNNINNECGINQHVGSNVNFRIINGMEVLPSQAPWLVALFIVRLQYEFQCVGSILTNRHIITAAHCLKFNFYSNDSIPPNVLLVALGRFKLHEFREHGTVNREVASYRIHPDYAHANTADSDLAILILRTSVEYSPFIKPICLWSDSTILQNAVNRTGYVMGWGRDEFGHRYTEEPRMARVPIVSQAECLWSDSRFVFLTSNRTFCAGLRDGSGPCDGDGGSGLVLFDATTSRYQLRGIFSRTGYDSYEPMCVGTKYMVYVDVAKYISWIREQISTT